MRYQGMTERRRLTVVDSVWLGIDKIVQTACIQLSLAAHSWRRFLWQLDVTADAAHAKQRQKTDNLVHVVHRAGQQHKKRRPAERSGRRSSARMESETGNRRSGRQDKGSSSRRAPSTSGRDAELKARKQKQLFIKIGVFAGIALLGFIIYSMLPNPNLPLAENKLGKAKELLAQFESAMEDKSTGGAKSLAKDIQAILKTPLFCRR